MVCQQQLDLQLQYPLLDDGSLYIADSGITRIRKVDSEGIITTFAGTGRYGFSGDGGPAKLAQLYSPSGVKVADDGTIYISDTWNNRIRKISPDGIINTIAGDGIRGTSGDGGPAADAQVYNPGLITIDSNDDVYFSDEVEVALEKLILRE